MEHASPDRLRELLLDYDSIVEVAIGTRTDLSADLAEAGISVTATDIVDRSVPEGVAFVRDDLLDPDPRVYVDACAIVSRNLPPELQRPTVDLARAVDADLFFTTLGTDPAIVPAEPKTLKHGTVFVSLRK